MSQPRAELYAALLNAHTGEIVRRSLSKWHRSSSKLTDSQITLHWINNDNKRLKQWVRNRVIEIQRFTTTTQWFYVQTSDMIADIGTRKGATIQDVDINSTWINGFEWMKYEESKLPFYSADAIKFSNSEQREMKQEVSWMQHHTILTSSSCRSFPKKSKKGINFLTISLILIVSTFILQLGLWLSSSNFARHSSIDQISSLHQSTYKQQSVYTQRFTLTMKTSIQQRYVSSKNVLPKSNISWHQRNIKASRKKKKEYFTTPDEYSIQQISPLLDASTTWWKISHQFHSAFLSWKSILLLPTPSWMTYTGITRQPCTQELKRRCVMLIKLLSSSKDELLSSLSRRTVKDVDTSPNKQLT